MSDLIAAALKEIEKHAALHPEEAQKVATEKAQEKTELVEMNVELWKDPIKHENI
jgi:hypothetical protein